MYEDMYKDYSNEEFPYNYPFSFRLKNKKYLEPYPPISAWWYYGETVNLELDLSDTEESFEGKQISVNIYNFRKEIVDGKVFVPNDINENILIYSIDQKTSNDVFTEGIYYLELSLNELDEEENIISTKVLIDNNDYLLRVV